MDVEDHVQSNGSQIREVASGKSVTYPYRKLVVGDFIHKILLFFAMISIDQAVKTGNFSASFVNSFLLGAVLIKGLASYADSILLIRYTVKKEKEKSKVEKRGALSKVYKKQGILRELKTQGSDILLDLALYGPGLIGISGILTFSDLGQMKGLIKCLLLLVAIGGDGILNRMIIKKNDQAVARWIASLSSEDMPPTAAHDRARLIHPDSQEAAAEIIRGLFTEFLPEEKNNWVVERKPLCKHQTLIYLFPPKVKKDPFKYATVCTLVKVLDHQATPSFQVVWHHSQIHFSLAGVMLPSIKERQGMRKQIVHVLPLVVQLRKAYPTIKLTDWQVGTQLSIFR